MSDQKNMTRQQWAELLLQYMPEQQQDGDLSLSEAMEIYGESRHVTKKIMDALVAQGELTEHRGLLRNGSGTGIFYRRV